MKYIITESRLSSIMTKFMDDYLSKYEKLDNFASVRWGTGKNNVMLYDVENEVLFIDESSFNLIRSVFSLEHHEAVVFIKDYMASKGYFVRRIA